MSKRSATPPGISTADLKKAILAVEAQRLKHPARFRPDRAQRATLQKTRRESEKALSVFFSNAGLDLEKFRAVQEKRSAELERMVSRHKADALKVAAHRKDALYSSIKAQSKALSDAAARTGFFPNPSFNLDTPFLIWSIPLTDISDSAAVPFGSWAKFKFSTSQSTTQKVGFYFYWPNPYGDYAVIDATTFFSAIGHLKAHAPWGISVNTGDVYAYADLNLWLGWPTDVTSTISDIEFLGAIGAYGSFFTGGDTEGTSVSAGLTLQATQFAVPPNAVVVFEVAIELDCDEQGGDIEADFESGDFQIACPVVVISLLNHPTGYPKP